MFCQRCGHDNAAENQFCGRCGQPLGHTVGIPAAAPAGPLPDARTDGKAVASLILGIGGLTFFSIFAGIPAVILGHMSRSNIKKSMGALKGEGMALAGLIMGYISFLAIPFILIIAAIAIPNLLRARISANEAGAVSAIRSINHAAVEHSLSDAKQGVPRSLKELGSGNDMPSELSSGVYHGYRFTYEATDTDGDQVLDAYFVAATPVTRGSSGVRSFCSDQTGIIRVAQANEECTIESPPI